MTVLCGARLNREKALCLAGLAALGLAGWHAAASRPGSRTLGEHRVVREAPASLSVALDEPGDVQAFLGGARNPFEACAEAGPGDVPSDAAGHKQEKMELGPLGGLTGPIGDSGVRGREKIDGGAGRSTELSPPVSFVGVLRADDGAFFVGLRDRATGENRRLTEGDVWPELGLRIVKIGMSGVLLENEGHARFVIRDVYGRRTSGGRE